MTDIDAPTLRARNSARLVAQAEAAASGKPFESIPHVDIARLFEADPAGHAEVAAELRAACLEVGFFYLSGHGVPRSQVEDTFDIARTFFAKPDEEKAQVSILNSSKMRGYTGLLEENTDPDNDGDLHEAFDIGLDLPADDPDANGDVYGWGVNQWPDLPGFREQMVGYHTAMADLSRVLYRGLALSLDLDADFFTSKMTKPISELRVIRYPSQSTRDQSVVGIGAHSDYDMFTVLATDDVAALEVLNPAGDWIPIPPKDDRFIVNVGDLLQRWTNDLYRSAVHRVINVSGRERYSLPYFSNIDPLTAVDVLDSCVTEDRPARYEPVGAAEYVEACMRESYGHVPPSA
ncbi:MAG: 2-oxoglutarate and iron-dependent oxygenase domain-containing protein [Actinomycetota bacterium]